MAIAETIPQSQMAGVQLHTTQDPTDAGSPGVIVPPAVLQILMKTSTALQPKPSAAPPHPQVTALTAAIAGGLQFSFKQLVSPTPYQNVIVSYRIYRNTSANTFSGAQLIRTIPHDNSANQKAVTVQDLIGSNKTASYFCTAVDSTGQESSLPGSFQSGIVNSGTFNPNIRNVSTTGAHTTNSATLADIPELTITATFKGGSVLITATIICDNNTAAAPGVCQIFRDGTGIGTIAEGTSSSNNSIFTNTLTFIDSPTAASHTYTIRFANGGGATTLTAHTTSSMQVVELG